MGFISDFLIIAALFGPGMAISYGLENPAFDPREYLFALLVLETLAVAIVYNVLRILPTDIRFKNKLLDGVVGHIHGSKDSVMKTMDAISNNFKKRFGDLGFYLALALISFAYGVFVAAGVAYFLRVSLRRAMAAIAAGAAVAIVFWWYLAMGAIPFVTPVTVFVVMTSLSAAFIIYGFVRENRVIGWIVWVVLDKKTDLSGGIRSNVNTIKEKIAKDRKKGPTTK